LAIALEELIRYGHYLFGEKPGFGYEKEIIGYTQGLKPIWDLDLRKTTYMLAITKNLLYSLVFRVYRPLAEKEYIVLLDCSGSMKGEKFEKALAIALSIIYKYKRVGLILFNNKIIKSIPPTENKTLLVNSLFVIPREKTNISIALEEAMKYAKPKSEIFIITDAVPTDETVDELIETVRKLALKNIKVHVIGINLKEGKIVAETIAKISSSLLYEF